MTTADEVRQFILDSEEHPSIHDVYNQFGNTTSTNFAIHKLQIMQEIIFVPDDEKEEVILYVKPSEKLQRMIDRGEFVRIR